MEKRDIDAESLGAAAPAAHGSDDSDAYNVVVADEVETVATEDRDTWTGRVSFVLACVGSAVGLGNFWRFPYLVFSYGGGPFLLPYAIALVLVGIPIMQLEMAVGQVFRSGPVQAYGALDKRFRGIGLANALAAFGIVSYYSVILAWGNVYLVESFFKDIPFSVYNITGDESIKKPTNHFKEDVLKVAENPYDPSVIISSSVFGGLIFVWVSVLAILWKGTKFLSKAIYVTVLLPVAMMLILLFIGASRPGAGLGVNLYLGTWDFTKLSEPAIWTDAFSQIFFSLSLSTGVMSAYASLNPRNSNCVQDGVIVSLLNCTFSFLAGFAVFTIVGYFREFAGISAETLYENISGPNLVFVVYPSALTLIGDNAGANVLCILFFLVIYFLGIDSAFSLIESVVYSVRELKYFSHFSILEITAYTIIICGMISIFYTSDLGFYAFDIIDFFIGSTALLVNGFFQSVATTWVYKRREVTREIGNLPVIFHEIAWFGCIVVFIILLTALRFAYGNDSDKIECTAEQIKNDTCVGEFVGSYSAYHTPTTIGISIGSGVGFFILFEGVASFFASRASCSGLYYLFLHQGNELRNTLNEVITYGKPSNWRLRLLWALLLKYIVPEILMLLFILRMINLVETNGYGGLPAGYQAIGALSLVGVFFFIAVGAIFPSIMEGGNGEVVEEKKASAY